MDEPLAQPAEELNLTAGAADVDVEAAEAGEFGHRPGVVHVVFLQHAEISIGAAVQC